MGFRSSSVSGGGITGFFGDRAFARSLMHIALPVTLQSMLRASFSIIDQVMIGQLGSASISGIGLGGKFASIHNVVLSAVTAAGAILISQYLGQGSRKNAARSYSVNLLVSLAIAAVFTLVSTGLPSRFWASTPRTMPPVRWGRRICRLTPGRSSRRRCPAWQRRCSAAWRPPSSRSLPA